MSHYFIGLDIGTQSTKAVVLESNRRRVISSASVHYDLIPNLPPGCKEQNPEDWISAVNHVVETVVNAVGDDRSNIRGIGVSGQQHGFVALDQDGKVIRPAKLWCDTSTSVQADEIVARLGGLERTIEIMGNGLPAGFTASKILWLKENEPENYARLFMVLLPHDYINYWLTGNQAMECGDASGTGLFDVRERRWSEDVIKAVSGCLLSKLPPLIGSGSSIGNLRDELRQRWGLSNDVIVSAGGGDNMMSAIGTGNVREGIVTASLGTSGTIYACSETPIIDPLGDIAAFCDSTGRWLPLVCTMNVTVATEMVRNQFGLSHAEFDAAVQSVPAGADGLLLLPFFEGERVPNCPEGTGIFFGIRPATFDMPHMARAAMEGATFGLNYGLNRLRQLGLNPTEIRLTGGGANSAVWRQIMADIFQVEVVPVIGEGAAMGAALHALWVYSNGNGSNESIESIADQFIELEEDKRVRPNPQNAAVYAKMQSLFDSLSKKTDDFKAHRAILSGI